jgi:hypothetical protein
MSTCVIPSRPHQAEAGLLICRTHLDELASDLVGIEEEAKKLDARPSMQIVWGGKGATLAREQSPVRLDAVVLNDTRWVRDADVNRPYGFDLNGPLPIFGVLHYFADKVREERALESPAPPTVKTERRLLTRQLDWCAAQPWIGELVDVVHRIHEQLQRVNGTAEPGPIPGRCPRLSDDRGGECGGRLWPVKPKHTSSALVHINADDVVMAIECERNANHHWEDKDLVRLAIILDQQAEAAS